VEDTDKQRSSVKTAKIAFDESKLTPPQREALTIAKAQGIKFGRKLEDLALKGVESDVLDKFAETLREIREDARGESVKNPFDE
jgi:hypothetical protein